MSTDSYTCYGKIVREPGMAVVALGFLETDDTDFRALRSTMRSWSKEHRFAIEAAESVTLVCSWEITCQSSSVISSLQCRSLVVPHLALAQCRPRSHPPSLLFTSTHVKWSSTRA